MRRHVNSLLAATLCLLGITAMARADDWPQWLGPKRDGIWREAGLLERIPDAGLQIRWRAPVRGGYAGPAVANRRVYVTDYRDDPSAPKTADAFQRITRRGAERVLCLDAATGKELWSHERPVAYTISYASGPRATPIIDDGRVYAIGGEGDLWCLDAATGKDVWSAKLPSGEHAPTPMWGFACHPLVEGDLLICQGGGDDPAGGHGVVTAFDKRTGAVRWTALASREPGYAPPMVYEVGGTRQLIVWHPEAVSALDPRTGRVLWTLPRGPARMGLTVATPRLIHDPQLCDVLFLSTFYEGAALLKIEGGEHPGARVLWARGGKGRNTDALHALFATPDIRDGRVYGVCASGELRCVDLRTGDRLWETAEATTYDAGPQKWATAFLVRLGQRSDRYLLANEHGDLLVSELTPTGYRGLGRAHVLKPSNTDAQRPVVWSHPACADRCVFWRNDNEMICVNFAAAPAERK
jgi:outer membrane protein assembly factor BamB